MKKASGDTVRSAARMVAREVGSTPGDRDFATGFLCEALDRALKDLAIFVAGQQLAPDGGPAGVMGAGGPAHDPVGGGRER